MLLWLLSLNLYKRPVFIVCQETCDGIQLINVAKKPVWNFSVKELVFLHSAYQVVHIHPQACIGLGLPCLGGRHPRSTREKWRPIDFARHKVINKKTSVDHDGHPRSQKGENPRLLHDLFVTDRSGIQRRDECDRPMRSNSKQPFEITGGLV